MEELMPTPSDITAARDPITEDIKYTSEKITKLNEARTPVINPVKGNQFSVINAIKLNPYLVKTKNGVLYTLQLSVTGSRGSVTNEIILRCDGKEFISHKLSAAEMQGINVLEHSLVTGGKTNLFYQEELIVTNVPVEIFDYLTSCQYDILMRAKGLKASIDSSIQSVTNDTKHFHEGMVGLKAVTGTNLK
jgi:hypothetical protein